MWGGKRRVGPRGVEERDEEATQVRRFASDNGEVKAEGKV